MSRDVNLTEQLTSDERIAEGVDWIQRALGENVVDERLAVQVRLRGSTMPEMFDTVSAGAKTDLFGWNLYVCYAYFFDQPKYDTKAGCRIVPTMASLRARVPQLEATPGAVERLREVANGTADFEKTLFELLVAASYAEAGWKPSSWGQPAAGRPRTSVPRWPARTFSSSVSGCRRTADTTKLSVSVGTSSSNRSRNSSSVLASPYYSTSRTTTSSLLSLPTFSPPRWFPSCLLRCPVSSSTR